MWIFQFIPDSWITALVYGIIALGAITYIMSKIWLWVPVLARYNRVLEIAGIALLALGVYAYGARANEQLWKDRVTQLESKLKIAEQQGQQINTVIEERVITETKIVKQQAQQVIQYIDREVVKYDTKFVPGGACEIPQEFVQALNSAAERPTK
jgi:hypothetical protein